MEPACKVLGQYLLFTYVSFASKVILDKIYNTYKNDLFEKVTYDSSKVGPDSTISHGNLHTHPLYWLLIGREFVIATRGGKLLTGRKKGWQAQGKPEVT